MVPEWFPIFSLFIKNINKPVGIERSLAHKRNASLGRQTLIAIRAAEHGQAKPRARHWNQAAAHYFTPQGDRLGSLVLDINIVSITFQLKTDHTRSV